MNFAAYHEQNGLTLVIDTETRSALASLLFGLSRNPETTSDDFSVIAPNHREALIDLAQKAFGQSRI